MLRTDTANFNRFLTSVGLALLAASLVIPYFYFGSTDTLEIPASELRGMTETGRDALSDRQHASRSKSGSSAPRSRWRCWGRSWSFGEASASGPRGRATTKRPRCASGGPSWKWRR